MYSAWVLSSSARSEDVGFLLFEWMDVWFVYRVWSVWKGVWMWRLSFLLVVWFDLCRGKHLSLEDVFWACFRGAQGSVDHCIALVCFE